MWVSAAVEERIPVEAIVVFYCLRLLLSILTLKLMGQVRSALQWKKINILSLLRYGTRTQKKHWYFLIRSTFLRDLKITPEQRLNRIIDRYYAVEFTKISLNFLNYVFLS